MVDRKFHLFKLFGKPRACIIIGNGVPFKIWVGVNLPKLILSGVNLPKVMA